MLRSYGESGRAGKHGAQLAPPCRIDQTNRSQEQEMTDKRAVPIDPQPEQLREARELLERTSAERDDLTLSSQEQNTHSGASNAAADDLTPSTTHHPGGGMIKNQIDRSTEDD
jgi:hypothetical protein